MLGRKGQQLTYRLRVCRATNVINIEIFHDKYKLNYSLQVIIRQIFKFQITAFFYEKPVFSRPTIHYTVTMKH
jgi:hypothetical protein